MEYRQKSPHSRFIFNGYMRGIGLTLLLSMTAKFIALVPFFSIVGQLVIAILLGMMYRGVIGVPIRAVSGIQFTGKKLLRAGIILLGIRLNLLDILQAGAKVALLAVINLSFTLFAVYGLCRWLKVEHKLGLLTACGTAICGAAAVVALSPQLKASDADTAVSAATVALLGTIFTIVYTLFYPVLGLSDGGYGLLSGSTLHEVAHVLAAAAPGGQAAVDLAILVKLTRVAMLVPVSMVISIREGSKVRTEEGEKQPFRWRKLPVPWFIFGFIGMSGVNTLGIIPANISAFILLVASLLLAMAMAGLGLGVDVATFRRMGKKPFLAALLGSVLLSVLGFVLVHAFGLV